MIKLLMRQLKIFDNGTLHTELAFTDRASNCCTGIWNGTMEWKTERNC